jgi:S-adenosylmethionine decarboxylase
MIEWIVFVVIGIAGGILVKSSDSIVDEAIKTPNALKYALGFLYGILIAGAAHFFPVLFPLAVGTVLAVFIYGKIDHPVHIIAVAVMILTLMFLGTQSSGFELLLFFFFFALFDEHLEEKYAQTSTRTLREKATAMFLRYRWGLKISCLTATIALNEPAYFLTIISFDAAYIATEKTLEKITEKKECGNHLILDCFECAEKRICEKGFIQNLLHNICSKLKMTKIADPVIVEYSGEKNLKAKNKTDYGITGFLLIAESHIAIHTFPKTRVVRVDVYSCKPFDSMKLKRFLAKMLQTESIEFVSLERGSKYPSDIRKSRELAMKKAEPDYKR